MRLNLNAEDGAEVAALDPFSDAEIAKAPAVYVPPFTVVIDTREQAPFRFVRIPATQKEGGGYVVPRLTTGRALPTGDYSVAGCESLFCVERKSLADLFACCGRERDRFEREFQRMADMRWSAVVVEADEFAVVHRPPRGTKIAPGTVVGTIESWSVRFPKTHWFLCHDRRAAEVKTYRLLARCWEQFGGANHNGEGITP